ncbi:uncharacterized protein LOC122372543 [Amphibalanus amphitrite]|uniref:uncharacterized protein LOC122372543 n=1 Tax=Amphibalanus amphitrite TaxID=1232801 RepID=UPI001C92A460|nr:uncharacterized protein LOC122372543 [Amphibalanus amphitrite]
MSTPTDSGSATLSLILPLHVLCLSSMAETEDLCGSQMSPHNNTPSESVQCHSQSARRSAVPFVTSQRGILPRGQTRQPGKLQRCGAVIVLPGVSHYTPSLRLQFSIQHQHLFDFTSSNVTISATSNRSKMKLSTLLMVMLAACLLLQATVVDGHSQGQDPDCDDSESWDDVMAGCTSTETETQGTTTPNLGGGRK